MAWKKREKRIVSSAEKEVSLIPTLKTALIPEIQTRTNFERAGGAEVLLPKVCGKGAAPKEIAERENEEIHRAEVRHRVGLNYELLCERVRDGLNAEMAILDSEGKIVNKVPANSERAKFIQAAIDILGAKKADVGAQKIPSIIIVLPDGRRL